MRVNVDTDGFEMPADELAAAMPPYMRLLELTTIEVQGLTRAQLDLDDLSPDREWMWWSIRRQISHMAWDSLVFTHRRCAHLLWPDGDDPSPIVWSDHHRGPDVKFDRLLDENLYWEVPDLLAKLELGLSWLEQVVTDHPIEVFRRDLTSVGGTYFWKYAISTLPRGAGTDPERPGYLQYTLEASLWMVFYEILTHIRTIQRLKLHQDLPPATGLPRVGYLRLPEYWGETDANGPSMQRLPVD